MIRIFEIKLEPNQKEDCLKEVVFNKLSFVSSSIDENSITISSKSIDARDKKNIRFVYNVDFEIKTDKIKVDINENKKHISEEKFVLKVQKKNRKIKIKALNDNAYTPVIPIEKINPEVKNESEPRPVIVGFGPAGIFAAISLLANGIKPIIIERGKALEERVEDVEEFWNRGKFNKDSNPLFGEGGAGTFSDGKLTTGKNDKRIPFILQEFYKAGAPKEILYAKKPHIGTDVLRRVIKTMRENMIKEGALIKFDTTFIGFETEKKVEKNIEKNVEKNIEKNIEKSVEKSIEINVDKNNNQVGDFLGTKLKSIIIKDNHTNREEIINTNHLILAIGHSARDTYKVLSNNGINMEQKPFSIGVRIEHDQAMINESQYGNEFTKYYGKSIKDLKMPAAEYKLSHRSQNGRGVYTFCMCPGGQIISLSAEEGTVSVNGMSEQKRDGDKANSAILVDVKTEDYRDESPLSGIEFQREYERRAFVAGGGNYSVPTETVGEFMGDNSKLSGCLPEFAYEGIREALPVFGRKIKGFDNPKAILKGIESGSSSPVRITRNKEYMSNIWGIYPCGEGAGYAGGITSAAIDGIKCAECIMTIKNPNETINI